MAKTTLKANQPSDDVNTQLFAAATKKTQQELKSFKRAIAILKKKQQQTKTA